MGDNVFVTNLLVFFVVASLVSRPDGLDLTSKNSD